MCAWSRVVGGGLMGSDVRNTPMWQEAMAVLSGLREAGGPLQGDPGLALAALGPIGDALRLGLDVPTELRRWMAALSAPDVAACLRAARDEVASWTLPAPGAAVEKDDSFAFTLRRRDALESAKTAVARILVGRGAPGSSIPGLAALAGDLRAFDERLAAIAPRPIVEMLLGTRGELLGERPWTARFADADDAASGADEPLGWNEAMLAGAPSDEVVTLYATSGALARYVEGFAAKSPAFAEELADAIDAFMKACEPVGFVARRWRKHAVALPGGEDALRFAERPAARLAAATEGEASAPEPRSFRLGLLTPVQAQARVVVSRSTASLWVHPEQRGDVTRIEIGGAVSETPADEEGRTWVATAALGDSPLRIRVVGSGDDVFEETIIIVETSEP
jgi:hypothetical protein